MSTALSLIAAPPEQRDPGLLVAAREAVVAAITTDSRETSAPGHVAAAVSLRAALNDVEVLTTGERALLGEWLDRLSTPPRELRAPR